MARSVRVELILDTLRGVRGAKDLSKATDQVAESLDETARQGARAGRAVDDAGDEMSEAARAAAAFDRQVEQLTGSLRQMAIQSALTGDVDLAGKMRAQQRQLTQIVRQRKLVGDDDAKRMGAQLGATLGVSTTHGLFAGLSAGLKAPPPQVYAGAALLVAAIAPTIGAGIAGAVVGGVAIGGVLGGMGLAARDPRVQAAGRELGGFMLADLEQRASGFVTPMVHGVQRVRGEWVKLGPDLDRIFDSSRFIDTLVDGSMRGVRRLVAGAADAVDAADPVVDQFADSIDRIGGAVGESFSLLAHDADAGASAIDDLTTAAENFIGMATGIIHVLALAKGQLDTFDKKVDEIRFKAEDTSHFKWLDLTADGFKKGTKEAEAYRRVNQGIATATDEEILKLAELRDTVVDGGDAAAQAALKFAETSSRLGSVKANTELVTQAQQGLSATFADVGAGTDRARQRMDALRKTSELLYGATMRNADANQTFEASWDDLSASVGKNKRTLDVHTAAGRANRSSLIGLLKSNNDLYFANIETGSSVASATKKHQARTEAVRKEAVRVGLNKAATDTLIKTYGRIPPRKTTNLVLTAVDRVADALLDLAAIQLHLAKGTPISGSLKKRLARAQYGMPDTKRAHGGPLPGHAPHDRADNMVYAGTPGEWVIQKPTVRKVERKLGSGAMSYFNKYGELPAPGYADGGLLRASRASWGGSGMYYRTTAGMTKIPTIDRVIAAVPFMMGGNWPSSPGAQRGDSGVWRQIVRMIRATGPISGAFGNAYRPGDPKWHGCFDLGTQILTRRGWVKHDELRINEDETIGYNPETGRSEWTRVVGIQRYSGAELVTMGHERWSVDATSGHRWITPSGMRTTVQLRQRDQLILAAPLSSPQANVSLLESELLGLIVADGSARLRTYRIHVKRPRKIAYLDSLLAAIPHTRNDRSDGGVEYWISTHFMVDLVERSQFSKSDPEKFVRTLSAEQASAFMRGIENGDGCVQPGRKARTTQRTGVRADAIALAIFISGHRPNVVTYQPGARPGKIDLQLQQISAHGPTLPLKHMAREVTRTADVWCPTTTLGTWTARQGEEIFLTGNSGRAVDWMGFNQDRLAGILAARRPLELIHRTRSRDYAYTRGRNQGSFNQSLMEAHRNHIHIAMGNGGIIPEHVVGVGRSGRTYEFAERGPERVTPMGAGAGGVTIHAPITINGANASPREIARAVSYELGRTAEQLSRGAA